MKKPQVIFIQKYVILFLKHNLKFKEEFMNDLTQKFNSDALTNKMEFDKLDFFLTNNTNVTEGMILKLISNNDDVNLNKIIEYCVNGVPKKALYYFQNIHEKSKHFCYFNSNVCKSFQIN